MLAGVAGAAYPDSTPLNSASASPCSPCRWAAQARDHLGRLGALHREHGTRAVLVGDGQTCGCALLQCGHNRGSVRGVGYEEDLVVGDVVGDQVIDDTAGIGAAQRVLRLARADAPQVVGEGGVDELRGAGPCTSALPRWLTSNSPTVVRVAVCSATVPAYDTGISQPQNSAKLAPSSRCRSSRGPCRTSLTSVSRTGNHPNHQPPLTHLCRWSTSTRSKPRGSRMRGERAGLHRIPGRPRVHGRGHGRGRAQRQAVHLARG